MKITHALIKKFLENQCNPAEASAVARYLKKHPELLDMYLRSSWDAAGKETTLPPGYEQEMLEVINSRIGKSARVVRFRWLVAAASVLMLLTAVWLLRTETRTVTPTVATAIKPEADSAGWKQYANVSGRVDSIKLQDGSVVELAPEAVIKYQEPFEANKRDIYLEGEADFEVAHDKKRPFTVHTKLFSTTALGTSFRVSESAAGCNIRLFTGKVIIRALNTLKGWTKDITLLPGSQMKYDLAKGIAYVERFDTTPKVSRQPKTSKDVEDDQEKLVFDNTPLSDVMKILIKKYQTPIEYEEDLLTGKYFSGEVLKGDSLALILKVIANLNGLQVTEKDNKYIVTSSR